MAKSRAIAPSVGRVVVVVGRGAIPTTQTNSTCVHEKLIVESVSANYLPGTGTLTDIYGPRTFQEEPGNTKLRGVELVGGRQLKASHEPWCVPNGIFCRVRL
jgi:hypothetical protein